MTTTDHPSWNLLTLQLGTKRKDDGGCSVEWWQSVPPEHRNRAAEDVGGRENALRAAQDQLHNVENGAHQVCFLSPDCDEKDNPVQSVNIFSTRVCRLSLEETAQTNTLTLAADSSVVSKLPPLQLQPTIHNRTGQHFLMICCCVFRLQDEYVQLQEELKATIEESKLVQEKYRQLLEQARKDYSAKHTECEELRTQVHSVCPDGGFFSVPMTREQVQMIPPNEILKKLK